MKEETRASGYHQLHNLKDPVQNENRGPLVQKYKNFKMVAVEDQSDPGPSEYSSSLYGQYAHPCRQPSSACRISLKRYSLHFNCIHLFIKNNTWVTKDKYDI